MNAAEAVISSNDVEKLTEDIVNVQETIQTIQEDPGELSKFLSTLPQKALSLGVRILLIVVIFIVCSKLIGVVRKITKKALEHAGISPNIIVFLDNVIKALLYALLILMLAVNLGFDASSIVALVGSIGVTIGLALQGSLSNFAGGVLLLLLKPFTVGDYIRDIDTNLSGTVEEVQLFYTKVVTDNGYEAMIPNGNLSNNSIINYSRHKTRQIIQEFGISYESDIDKARQILLDITLDEPSLIKEGKPEPAVFVKSLDDSCVTLVLRAFFSNQTYLEFVKLGWRINEKAKKEFNKAGIDIPFKQVDVLIKNNV
ncbi:MAG: mechanosensitive ion channel family protein [Lachnospiraceae bacterium]|nr:mechanosensitive ion channel family protein [Lachnospiraceae bacterium]